MDSFDKPQIPDEQVPEVLTSLTASVSLAALPKDAQSALAVYLRPDERRGLRLENSLFSVDPVQGSRISSGDEEDGVPHYCWSVVWGVGNVSSATA